MTFVQSNSILVQTPIMLILKFNLQNAYPPRFLTLNGVKVLTSLLIRSRISGSSFEAKYLSRKYD